MRTSEKELEKLIEQSWEESGDNPCGGCDGTIIIYTSPDGKGQAEYCPDCGLNIK